MNGVIYARYSSENQREGSIDGQLRECKAFAEHNDIRIVDNYIDRALSAKTDNRPSFQKMIRDSAKGEFDVIIVWKLDRFARNRYDSAHYKNILKKNGVRVISATEAISEGAEGIILESVLEGMAEYYSAELAEKVSRGMKENALKCKYNGGSIPIGYCIDENSHFQIDPNGHFIILIILLIKAISISNILSGYSGSKYIESHYCNKDGKKEVSLHLEKTIIIKKYMMPIKLIPILRLTHLQVKLRTLFIKNSKPILFLINQF